MLRLDNISKTYGDFKLHDIDLEISKGEYFVLLGRSGAGKSQLLELIAGLRRPDSGSIFLNGQNITSEKIQHRKTGIVFQDFAIFPHLDVYNNIAYSLKIRKLPKDETDRKVREMAASVNITHLLGRKPGGLSGGERQRLAVARTLVTSPDIILLDEPMASIDTTLRDDVRRLLRKINDSGMTIMHVTHDYQEAVRLAHRVGVIHNGKILQTGEPDEVFSKPVNKFVARFAGIRNFYRVKISCDKDKCYACSAHHTYNVANNGYGNEGLMMIRSDAVELSTEEFREHNCIRARITEINRAETGYEIYLESGDKYHVLLKTKDVKKYDLRTGQFVFLLLPAGEIRII